MHPQDNTPRTMTISAHWDDELPIASVTFIVSHWCTRAHFRELLECAISDVKHVVDEQAGGSLGD